MIRKLTAGTLGSLAMIASLAVAPGAWAGAPLKGCDVKLGRPPGGSAAARVTTNADGFADLGHWPAGHYELTFTPPSPVAPGPAPTERPDEMPVARPTSPPTEVPVVRMHVIIEGAVGGTLERDVISQPATERQEPVEIELDGLTDLSVRVSVE